MNTLTQRAQRIYSASLLHVIKHRLFIFLSLYHPSNHFENISVFRKIIGKEFVTLHASSYAHALLYSSKMSMEEVYILSWIFETAVRNISMYLLMTLCLGEMADHVTVVCAFFWALRESF